VLLFFRTNENHKILIKCVENEEWKVKEAKKLLFFFNNFNLKGKDYTNSVFDFCSLTFKSAELLNNLMKLHENNYFKNTLSKRMEIMIHQGSRKKKLKKKLLMIKLYSIIASKLKKTLLRQLIFWRKK